MNGSSKLIPLSFLMFALFCFLTASVLNGFETGKDFGGKLPGKTLWGPVTVDSGNHPMRVNIKLAGFRPQVHSTLSMEILDKNKKALSHFFFSVNDAPDLFDNGLSEDVTLTGPGTYYFRLRAEKPWYNAPAVTENVALSMLEGRVSIRNLLASYAPFALLGIFSILIGIGLYIIQNRKENRKIVRSGKGVSRQ